MKSIKPLNLWFPELHMRSQNPCQILPPRRSLLFQCLPLCWSTQYIALSGTSNNIMRNLYQILSLSPAPLFFLGFIYSAINPMHICSSWPYEMSLMWLVMFLAHLTPWLLWFQQRNLTRNWKTAVVRSLYDCPTFPVVYLQQIHSISGTPYKITYTYHTHGSLDQHCCVVFTCCSN